MYLVRHVVMDSAQVTTLEAKGRFVLDRLFLAHLRTKGAENWLPADWREAYDNAGPNRTDKARVIADYISGMTDLYAQTLFSRLFVPFEGTVYDHL